MIVRELITKLGFQLDQTQVNKAERATQNLKQSANNTAAIFGRIAFSIASAFSVRRVIGIADEMQSLRARVGMLPQTMGDVGAAFDTVAAHASASGTSIEAYATLYSRVGNAAQDYIKTQEDLLKVTDTISKALTVGGTSTAEASAVMIQFSQALASGVLQGDEFRSMAEAAPQYLQRLSEELNIPRQNLKKMASEGKLTAKEVIEATKRMSDYFDLKFKSMPMTVGRAMTIIGNRFKLGIDNMNRDTDFVRIIADKIITAFDVIEAGVTKVVAAFDGWNNMLRIIGITIGVMLGAKILPLILQFATMSVAAILPWLAIAAAILAVAFLIEDVIVWINGGNSVLGEFLGKWEDVRWIARAALDFIGDALLAIGKYLGAVGAMIVGAFTLNPALFLEGLDGLTTILMDTLKKWGEAIYKMYHDPIVNAVKDAWEWITNMIGRATSAVKGIFGFGEGGAANPPILTPRIGANQLTPLAGQTGPLNLENNTTVNVVVPPGTTIEQADFLKRSANSSFSKAADDKFARSLAVYAP